MVIRFIKRAIIKAIKKRVLKQTQRFGDYKNVTSFIINAPMKEWRSRLWLLKISQMEQAFAALMRNYISGSIAVEDSLDPFNTAINLYCPNLNPPVWHELLIGSARWNNSNQTI